MKAVCKSCLPVAALLLNLAMPTQAQSPSLVNVDLRNARILNNVARDLSVDIRNVPITVQVPISIAVDVCQVAVGVLANAINRGGASCYAQSTSTALTDIVRKVMDAQN